MQVNILPFILFFVLNAFSVKNAISQDQTPFSGNNQNFFAGIDLAGGFPIGNFTEVDTRFPCNSSVSTGTLIDLTLGYRFSPDYGLIAILYDGSFELDPSSNGVSQLVNTTNGLYQSAEVLKSGQWVSQGINAGAYYNFLIGSNNLYLRPRILIGITGCRLPEIVIVGNHNPTTANKSGNSIDTVETWDTPSAYSYMVSYRIGAGLYYQLNKSIEIFVTIDYQGSPMNFNFIPTSYNLTVNATNSATGTATPLSSSTTLYESNPKINFQTINFGAGCLFRFKL